MLDGWENLFDSSLFMPHGHCYLWRPSILWLNVGSDALIALAYYAIPLFLVYLVQKRKDLAFNWIFVMFAFFILACGSTHLLEIWTVWHPDYAVQGFLKLFTALVSLATAAALGPLMPKALSMPSPQDLKIKTDELQLVNAALQQMNATLEDRVAEKTRELSNFASIVQFSNDAIIGENNEGMITAWNPAAQKLFGYDASEILGKSSSRLVPADEFPRYSEVMNRIQRGEAVKSIDSVRLTKSGARIDISLTISPIEDHSGKIIGSSSIARDIADRIRGESARKHNEEKLRQVIEAAPNGLMMVDHSGNIVLCNAQIELLFGYTREELTGCKIEMLVPERFRGKHPEYRGNFFQSPTTRQMGSGRDLFGLRKDGNEFPVEIGLNPLEMEEGLFVLASVVDITKRKALDDRLVRFSNAVQQKNLEMEQFVYTVSHDLKSPLVTSTGFLGFLKEAVLAGDMDKVLDSVARLERANNRMSQLITDLLQLSRIGRFALNPQIIDVAKLVQSVCENLSVQIKERNIAITVEDAILPVIADQKRMYQVFENLIVNALKYAGNVPKPKIIIGSKKVSSETHLFVKDNGPGIAPEYHQKIFGLFERLVVDKDGTGVGLTIVARILQLHSGRAWVESEPGRGATFWLAFPDTFSPVGGIENA